MKPVLFAGALAAALSLTALAQQRAAAQSCPPQCQRGGEVTFSTGITFGLHWTPKCGHWVPDCPACGGYPPPYGYPGYGYAPPQGYPSARPLVPPPPPPGAPPAPPLPPPPPAANSAAPAAVQNIGYSYPAAYGYDYGYGYNYGYPLYQAPDYWYGR